MCGIKSMGTGCSERNSHSVAYFPLLLNCSQGRSIVGGLKSHVCGPHILGISQTKISSVFPCCSNNPLPPDGRSIPQGLVLPVIHHKGTGAEHRNQISVLTWERLDCWLCNSLLSDSYLLFKLFLLLKFIDDDLGHFSACPYQPFLAERRQIVRGV